MKVLQSRGMTTCYHGFRGDDCQIEDVVISGASGRFPESENIDEFERNLFSGVDMVTESDRRWPIGIFGLPTRNGTLKDISGFDAEFFGISPKQADNMDPQLRMLLEVSYEAIFDAGVNPASLKNSNTGVFIGSSSSESLHAFSNDPSTLSGYSMSGSAMSMLANRLSFFFGIHGPSYPVDTACSSSLVALDNALAAIKSGQCESAIVAAVNLLARPQTSLQFQRLGMLAADGKCRSFDASGTGYVRSETVAAVFLQKMPNSKRFYATIVHSKINTDGAKPQGITFPSGEVQKRLLNEVYAEANVNPGLVSYVEAHGTGTKAGDPQELNSIAEVFTSPKLHRATALMIGSTKSNMGHPEPASGLAALVKCLIAIRRRELPGNLHFESPNPEIPALLDQRLKVVDRNMEFNHGLLAINSFGFGGVNGHLLLKPNFAPSDAQFWSKDLNEISQTPRLLTFSSRTEEGVQMALNQLKQNPTDLTAHFLLQVKDSQPFKTRVKNPF